MSSHRPFPWTRWLAAFLGIGVPVAAFVLATVLGWVAPGEIPRFGPWIEKQRLSILLAALVFVVVGSLVLARLRRSTPGRSGSPDLPALSPRLRTDLLDALTHRYRQVLGDSLRYRVGEWLQQTGAPSSVTIHLPLELRTRPDQILRPELRLRNTGAADPQGAVPSLLGAHDASAGRLLVLGDPGAGKSTFLLGLAVDLIARAGEDAEVPIPVIVNLAAWGEDRLPLADWLERRLPEVLGVSKGVARTLVRGHHLHLLLDGLDEVEEGQRGACIEAINAYLGERGEKAVVCCRTAEYEAVQGGLELRAAVEILPLDVDEVVRRLSSFPQAREIQHALLTDGTLRALVTTPLVLSVLLLTYLGSDLRDFGKVPQAHRLRFLWDDYLVEMLRRWPATFEGRATTRKQEPRKMLTGLAWLARRLKGDDQTDFLLDHLQPRWLGARAHCRWFFGSIASGVYGVASGLGAWEWATPRVGGEVALVLGVAAGLAGAWLAWFLGRWVGEEICELAHRELPAKDLEIVDLSWKATWRVRAADLVRRVWARVRAYEIRLAEDMRWSPEAAFSGFRQAWKQSLLAGLVVGVFGAAADALGGAPPGVGRGEYLLIAGLLSGLGGSLLYGIYAWFEGGVVFKELRVAARPGDRIRRTLRNGIWGGGGLGLVLGLVCWWVLAALNIVTHGLGEAENLFLGWGLFGALGLCGGFFGGLVFWARGALEHFLLRWVLDREDALPWKAERFLQFAADRLILQQENDLVRFRHILLRDHMAAMTPADIERLAARIEGQSPAR